MNLDIITKYRRDLHQIPELGFHLPLTYQYLKDELTSLGFETEDVAKRGIVAIRRGEEKEAIAFRADMDGLNVEEKTNVSFSSKHLGKMHACGHDGHMAILLGFANLLSQLPPPKCTIVLIFQPAEEGPGGAKVIVNEGILTKYHVKAIFGIHLYPELEEGKIGLVDGPMMAQSGEFDITLFGRSSHGALPHLGVDAILASSQLITNYQTIISRNIDTFAPAVVTIGTIKGGEARNIIAQKVFLTGTIRSFDKKQYQYIKTRITEINKGIEEMYNVNIEMEIRDFYPPVVNDSDLYNMVKKKLREEDYQIIKPMMFSEDFSYYQQAIPGFLMMLGTKNQEKGYVHPLHSCYFNFNEKVLLKGIDLYLLISQLF